MAEFFVDVNGRHALQGSPEVLDTESRQPRKSQPSCMALLSSNWLKNYLNEVKTDELRRDCLPSAFLH
jgi:hypothetical protein